MDDVYRWALGAEPGERVVYHVGDRPRFNPELSEKVASAFGKAFAAHKAGLVFLAQRRARRGRYAGRLQYEATRLSEEAARKLGLLSSVSYVAVR